MFSSFVYCNSFWKKNRKQNKTYKKGMLCHWHVWAHPLLGFSFFNCCVSKENLLGYLRHLCLAVTRVVRHLRDSLREGGLESGGGDLDRHQRYPRGFASRDGPQISELTKPGLTSTTPTMTWLGSWLVRINQLVRKTKHTVRASFSLHASSQANQWTTIIHFTNWIVHFDCSVEKRTSTHDRSWRSRWFLHDVESRNCTWQLTERRFDKITTRQ